MNIVFCFGVPKSGTTFLQMILNSHLQISCPSEHQFDYFYNELPKIFNNYNQILEIVDKRTGNQGIKKFHDEDLTKIFAIIIQLAAKRGANGKQVLWYGLNDNAIINKMELYLNLFPNAKFICIVRDPRSITVSSWYHNHRVEPNFIERAVNMENWALTIGHNWHNDMAGIFALTKNDLAKNRLIICRYEDLLLKKEETVLALFNFLSLVTTDDQIHDIIEATDFKKFNDKKFFRKASTSDWKTELSEESIRNIENVAKDLMKVFNYL